MNLNLNDWPGDAKIYISERPFVDAMFLGTIDEYHLHKEILVSDTDVLIRVRHVDFKPYEFQGFGKDLKLYIIAREDKIY